MSECYSCHCEPEPGEELVAWTFNGKLSAVLEQLGYFTPVYCLPCTSCAVCGVRVAPGEGAPAQVAWGYPAMHRTCLSSKHPAARYFYEHLRAALLGENVP